MRSNMFNSTSGSKSPGNKPPDAAAVPMSPSEPGLAPWQIELQKRKAAGSRAPTWKRKTPPEPKTTLITDDDDDDAAALFFSAAPSKSEPKTAEMDEDAAALFFGSTTTSTRTSDSKTASDNNSSSSTSEDAANLFHAASTDKTQQSKSVSSSDSDSSPDKAAKLFPAASATVPQVPKSDDSDSDSDSSSEDAAKVFTTAKAAPTSNGSSSSSSTSDSDSDSSSDAAAATNRAAAVVTQQTLASSSSSGSSGSDSSSDDAAQTKQPEASNSDSSSDSDSSSTVIEEILGATSLPPDADVFESSSSGGSESPAGEGLPEETLEIPIKLERLASEYITYEERSLFEEASQDDEAEEESQEATEEEEVIEEEEEYEEEEVIEEDEEGVGSQVLDGAQENIIVEMDDSATSDQVIEPNATSAGSSPQHAILAELEFVESQMRDYINSIRHDTSAMTVLSEQSSIPWGMPSNQDRDSLASYASYVRSTIAEKPSFDQNSYVPNHLPDSADVGITNSSQSVDVEDSATDLSSEQSSMPWIVPYHQVDSWANPVRQVIPKQMFGMSATENNVDQPRDIGQSESISKRSKEDPPQVRTSASMPSSRKKRPRKALPNSDASISMQVYRSSIPDPSRDTDLWYHPGFSMLNQDSRAPARQVAADIDSKQSPSGSLNESTETDKAIVADAEVVEQVYNTSIPKFSKAAKFKPPNTGTKQRTSSTTKYPSRTASLSRSGEADSRWKHIDFMGTIRRNSFPWVPGKDTESPSSAVNNVPSAVSFANSDTSSESSSSRRSDVYNDEPVPPKKVLKAPHPPPITRKVQKKARPSNVVRSKNSLSPGTSTETKVHSVSHVRKSNEQPASNGKPGGMLAYLFLFLCLVTVPAAIAVTLIMTNEENAEVKTPSSNETTSTRLPTIPPAIQTSTPSAPATGDAPTGDMPSTSSMPMTAPTAFPTATAPDPTDLPTTPDPVPQDLLFRLLASSSSDGGESLMDRRTPQFSAMEWLRTPQGNQGVYNDAVFLQRYALATIYFATDGNNWNSNEGWLTTSNECDWFFSSTNRSPCDSNGRIVELNLENNGLQGSIPNEIDILFQLGKHVRLAGRLT
eukprot:scaffold3670_cov124-Cylindrotheca_fusiformis.AAC.5